ncbi:MAG: hypothetical protein V1704_00900 [Candidatus Vogelbacteria bacterium]
MVTAKIALITPRDVYKSDFTNSMFRDCQMDMFLSCIAITQFKMNPDAWTPFSWKEYTAKCDHTPIPQERQLLEAMATGGSVYLVDTPPVGKTHTFEGGYFEKRGGKYVITPKLLAVMQAASPSTSIT